MVRVLEPMEPLPRARNRIRNPGKLSNSAPRIRQKAGPACELEMDQGYRFPNAPAAMRPRAAGVPSAADPGLDVQTLLVLLSTLLSVFKSHPASGGTALALIPFSSSFWAFLGEGAWESTHQ